MVPTKVYRGRIDYVICGMILFVIGVGAMGYLMYRANSGIPTYVSSGRGHPSHLASRDELMGDALLCWIFPLCGIGFIAFRFLASVTLDSDGVILRNGMGMEKFRVRYDEIDTIGDVRQGNRILLFSILSHGNEYTISNVYERFDEIRDSLIMASSVSASNARSNEDP